jgi:hypothetical protein
MKAADIMREIKQPVPWVVIAEKAIAGASSTLIRPVLEAAAMRLLANGAVSIRGYAGNTQVGVIM